MIVVEGRAPSAVAADRGLEFTGGLVQIGGGRRGVDDAGGTADAEEQGVGTSIDFNALDVVALGSDDGAVEISSHGRLGEAAHAGADLAIAEGGLGRNAAERGRDAGERAAKALHFHVGLVDQDVAQVGRAGVFEEFGVHDRYRRAEIGQLGVQPDAGQGATRLVADVGGGVHLERRQHDHVRVRRGVRDGLSVEASQRRQRGGGQQTQRSSGGVMQGHGVRSEVVRANGAPRAGKQEEREDREAIMDRPPRSSRPSCSKGFEIRIRTGRSNRPRSSSGTGNRGSRGPSRVHR